MPTFASKFIDAAKGEYKRWDDGAGRETWGKPQHSKDYYLFVKDYWMSIGNKSFDGRTEVKGIRPAWSSAFVGYCAKTAGAAAGFHYTEAHCHYINKAMKLAAGEANNFGFEARRTSDYKPNIGDIICSGREYAELYDYDQAELVYKADSFYPSHGDIVVDVTNKHAVVIGGNIKNNVDTKKLALTDTGFLGDRIKGGKEIPWICILQCLL